MAKAPHNLRPGQRCTHVTAHIGRRHHFDPALDADYKRLAAEGKPIPPRCAFEIEPLPPPTPEEVEAGRKRMADHARERCIDSAIGALDTMEGFIRNARNRLRDVTENPEARDVFGQLRFLQLPEQVLHELSWGFANASNRMGSCIDAAQEFLRAEGEKKS